MEFSEFFVGVITFVLAVMFLYRWYRCILSKRELPLDKALRIALGSLPAVVSALILVVLLALASFDVEGIWLLYYLFMGLAWLYAGLVMMFAFFDLSWMDDALDRNSPAAAIAVMGGSLGLTFIYSGANVGDGPGWWCVILAGGLGLIAWFVLGGVVNRVTQVFLRITAGRDIGCALRTAAYLLASGLILARACAGDWTSFSQTAVEFLDGWPVLLLTAVFLGAERLILRWEQRGSGAPKALPLAVSGALGMLLLCGGVLTLYLLPSLPENPSYQTAAETVYDWSGAW